MEEGIGEGHLLGQGSSFILNVCTAKSDKQ